MFRPMRRSKQQVSEDECKKVLVEEKRAAISVVGENGYPYAVPVDFFYDPDCHKIYIHGAKSGHKIDAIKNCNKVCFTVWNQGYKEEGHWEWNSTSVVIFGRARLLENDSFSISKLRQLTLKYYPTLEEAEKEMESPAISRVQMVEIEIDYMSGKLVKEK